MRGLTPEEQLVRIVGDSMCIGCGACQSIAGAEGIRMEIDDRGDLQPVITGSLSSATMDRVLRVCPGTRVEGLPENLVRDDSHYDEVWGVWRQIALAWAAEPAVRHLGSTGGLLTALALYLLERGKVDFIVHARASANNPTFGERTISRTRAQVLDAAGSRYGPTATLIDIRQIVEQAVVGGETFAFIGTPCDVNALRNLASEDQTIDLVCQYMLTMVCGGFMSPAGLRTTLEGFDIDPDTVTMLRYRGKGCPGPTRIETRDGKVFEKDYLDFWGEDDSTWQLPLRCKVCPDGIGDAADIAASDTWDGGAPGREGQDDDPGTNAALVRSQRGESLLSGAIEAGYVTPGKSITPRDLDRFQPHQVRKKLAAWARFAGRRSVSRVVPDVRGLRLKPLARRNSLRENLKQARGGRDRSKG